MNRSLFVLCVGCAAGAGSPASARPDVRTWTDATNDAVVRRTDSGNDDPLVGGTLPDLITVSISGWSPTSPTADPFIGAVAPPLSTGILKLDLLFQGLVNPPGPIQFPDIPTLFGPNPVYGFLDFDVDQDINTGGEQTAGRFNYLEQIGRFGALPTGLLADRAVTARSQIDFDFFTPPYYERSGADFTLTLCGCTPVSIVSRSGGDADDVFETGETWIVRGKFFQRSAGYQCASACFGGFEIGLYEPEVNLRFRNENNRTTISLIFPLTMQGAATLAGGTVQPADLTYGGANHFSVYEALADVINEVNANQVYDECTVLATGWAGRDAANYLNPTLWNTTAIFGTTYAVHPIGASFVWTDVGFSQVVGDLTGEGVADTVDRGAIQSYIAAVDGTADDADGLVNNAVQLPDFGSNFNIRDINYDGFVNMVDVLLIPAVCPADWDRRNGLNTNDFFAFLEDFFAGNADFNGDGLTNSADFLAYISAFFTGCP